MRGGRGSAVDRAGHPAGRSDSRGAAFRCGGPRV